MRTLACSALLVLATTAARASEPPLAVTDAPADAVATSADPNLDRGFVLPTAMTQPAGSITYNNYELLLHGVTYGVTDDVQLSATVLAPIVKDMPLIGLAAIKARLYRGQRLHLALQGSIGGASIPSHSENDRAGSSNDGILLGGLGGLASVCLRQDCSSLLSASATYEFATGSGDHGGALVYGVSAVHRVGPHVKLLAELASAGTTQSFDAEHSALLSYGVRFYGNNIASDIGFIKPIGADIGGPFVVGLPFASISYRWQ
jgi:hypothetical protein